MSECIFCQIVTGESEADVVYADDSVMAFHNIDPQTPVHIVLIPKEHIPSIDALSAEHRELVDSLFTTARHLGAKHDQHDHGYRISVNSERQAEIPHLHLHVHTGSADLDNALYESVKGGESA